MLGHGAGIGYTGPGWAPLTISVRWRGQCNQLPGKTLVWNDLFCVEQDVKPYTLTHWLTHAVERVIVCSSWSDCRMPEAAALMLPTLPLLWPLEEFVRHSRSCLLCVMSACVRTLSMDTVVGKSFLLLTAVSFRQTLFANTATGRQKAHKQYTKTVSL